MPFEKYKYQNDYNKEHYARLSVLIPLEDKEELEKYWKNKGFKSFSAFANELIRREMNEENGKSNVNVEKIENQEGGTIQIG